MSPRYPCGVSPHHRAESDRALLIVILAVVAIAGTVFLGCGGLLIWRFVLPVNVPAADLQTPDERQAELRAAFSATDVGIPPDEVSEFEDLFDDFTEIAGSQEESRFPTLIHLERLHEEMHRSGQMPEQPRLFDILLQQSLSDQIWLPVYATRYRIVRVAREEDSHEAVVYVHFWDDTQAITEMRVWTTRDSGRWRFYDWEVLQCGMRASFELALYESPGVEIYFELFNQMSRADRFFEQADYDRGADRLRKCEQLLSNIANPLREQARMHLIARWMNYGYHAEAAELARGARSPAETPRAIYARMVYNDLQGRHEQVLLLCDEYEDAIGPGPNAASYRAVSLAALDRVEEANAAREQYLSWDPDNSDVLAEFALDLADEDKGRVNEYLGRAPDSLHVARMLAERFSSYGDETGLSTILAFLEHDPSAAAEVEYVNGLLLESQGADIEAADRFLEALRLQTDEFARSDCFWSYMACMKRLGRELQAYERAPDPDEAFDYLANGDFEEDAGSPLPPALLRQLVERHRQRSPDDAWWAYHLGDLHWRDGEIDEAMRWYEVGLGNLGDDDEYGDRQWVFDSRIQTCLVEAGRWRDAYVRGGATAETFETLASDLYYREQFDILRELVELHRVRSPDDPMGGYYAAQLALRAERFGEADRLLSESWSRLDEEDYRRYSVRSARVSVHVAAGHPLDAYGAVPPDDETFGQLAVHFQAERDFESLAALIDLRRVDAPDDPAPLYWRANAAFLQDDYAGVLETVADADPELIESMEEYTRSQWEMLQLRSLLRTDQFPAAVELARDISERQASSRALIVALACSGRYDEALELFPGFVDYAYDSIYDDPDAGALLRSDTFRPVRDASPPGIPWISTAPLVALLDEPLAMPAARIQPVVTELFGPDARVTELPRPHATDIATCVVSIGEPCALVVCGTGPYQDDLSELRPGLYADVRRWEALAAHRAWCAFVLLNVSDETDRGLRLHDVRRLAGRFFGEEWLAYWDGAANRILIPSDGLPDLLLDPESEQDFAAAGESLWIYPSGSDDGRWIVQERIQRLLHGAIREWSGAGGAASLEVTARISANPAREPVRIRIDAVRRAAWYGWTLTGHLIDDSQLVPRLKSGEPVRIESSSVIDWTLTNGPVTTNALTEARQWWQRTRNEGAETPRGDPAG